MATPANNVNGPRQYLLNKIDDALHQLHQKEKNLIRLRADTIDLNSKVRKQKDELELLEQPWSYVGEVLRVTDTNKVLVKVHAEGKYVVDVDKSIDVSKLTPSTRVALCHGTYTLLKYKQLKISPRNAEFGDDLLCKK